jgi:NAD(P)-dependent dehydrogenase (short-subunit alcohol dehydrogenase family)
MPEDFMRLPNTVSFVTGGGSGIGRAIAERFAREGSRVAVVGRRIEPVEETARRIDAAGGSALAIACDVTDTAAVDAAVAEASAAFGPIDILVNNAGGGFHARFLDVNEKGQDSLMRENFTSVTNFVRATVPCMPLRGASIVNITSIEAHRAAPGFAVYSAMKAAVGNLTKTLALELGDRLVRVNAIAPDVIPTPGIGDVPVNTPLPRQGHVDDVAAAVVYLASDLSAFVTGVTLHVDGGNLAAGGWHRLDDGTFHT